MRGKETLSENRCGPYKETWQIAGRFPMLHREFEACHSSSRLLKKKGGAVGVSLRGVVWSYYASRALLLTLYTLQLYYSQQFASAAPPPGVLPPPPG